MSFEGKPPTVSQAAVWDGTRFVHQTVAIPSLRSVPNNANTVLRWALDEAAGATTWANTGTFGTNGNLIVSSGTIRSGRPSLFGSGAEFTPTSFIRNNVLPANIASTVFSIYGWIRLRSVPGSGFFTRLISKWYTSAGNTPSAAPDAFAILMNQSSRDLYVQTNIGGAGGSNKGTTTVPRDQIVLLNWAHVAATFNTGTVRIYVNGNLALTDATFPGSIDFNGASGGYWSLGGTTVGSSGIDGDLDDWFVDSGIEQSESYFKSLVNSAWNR